MSISACTWLKLGPATQRTLQLSSYQYIALIKLLPPWGIYNQILGHTQQEHEMQKLWLFWHPWALKLKMPWKEELAVAERLHYLPMQLTAYSLQSRKRAETSLNILAGESRQSSSLPWLSGVCFTQEVTRSSDFFFPSSLCFKDSLWVTEFSLPNLFRLFL